jgi:diacylglycerol kinase (ATP)
MSKTTVILNPVAGRGAGARLLPQINEWLHDHGLDFEMAITEAPGHAVALAQDAASQGQEKVVAVGGDGTANEVLNGLMLAGADPKATALGVLPIGTGNDFAVGAGIPLDLQDACRVLAGDQSRILDVGLFKADGEGSRFFGNGIGIGFDAAANIESRKLKRLKGSLLYLVAVIRTLAFYYDAPQARINIDDEELVQPCLMVSVMNGWRMGGAFKITPHSQMDDGFLDLCVARKVSRAKMVGFVPRFIRGSHITDPDIAMRRGRKVSVVSDKPWVSQVDGEIYGVGASRFEVELHPQRLCLLC